MCQDLIYTSHLFNSLEEMKDFLSKADKYGDDWKKQLLSQLEDDEVGK
jgi:hypothetical protein